MNDGPFNETGDDMDAIWNLNEDEPRLCSSTDEEVRRAVIFFCIVGGLTALGGLYLLASWVIGQ